MNPAEFHYLARAEEEFWWFRGMRRILFTLLDPLVRGPSHRVGAGSGMRDGALRSRAGATLPLARGPGRSGRGRPCLRAFPRGPAARSSRHRATAVSCGRLRCRVFPRCAGALPGGSGSPTARRAGSRPQAARVAGAAHGSAGYSPEPAFPVHGRKATFYASPAAIRGDGRRCAGSADDVCQFAVAPGGSGKVSHLGTIAAQAAGQRSGAHSWLAEPAPRVASADRSRHLGDGLEPAARSVLDPDRRRNRPELSQGLGGFFSGGRSSATCSPARRPSRITTWV
jgi:hypothetical protein